MTKLSQAPHGIYRVVIQLILLLVAIGFMLQARAESTADASTFLKRGVAKKHQGDFQGAIADYTEAIRLDPSKSEAYLDRGIAKRHQDDYQGAIADYNEAIRRDPKNADAYFNRGVAKRR
jgi:tetratricopeptide (TPR) repeat protein